MIAELLWFISGSTSSLPLSEAGIKIWDGNGSREFLDSVGLAHRQVGDLGPVYGFQWRHFGAEYVDARTDYRGQGVDQLAEVVEKLKHQPYDRRIILSAWNPADLKKMALPPCHMFAQFYVSFPSSSSSSSSSTSSDLSSSSQISNNDNTSQSSQQQTSKKQQTPPPSPRGILSCQLYQRSCDIGLGVPFNIASYALLTHMLAKTCNLTPGTFIMTMGDAHIYSDHVDALKAQLEREPREFPELVLLKEKEKEKEKESGCEMEMEIDGWSMEDFEVRGYKPHPAIGMKMSV